MNCWPDHHSRDTLQILGIPKILTVLVVMTYATRQLTEALQELTSRSAQLKHPATERETEAEAVRIQDLHLSKEVEDYIEQKRAYSERTRSVNTGQY